MNHVISTICLLLFAGSGLARQAIDTALAIQYFAEARQASQVDDGAMWGKSLYGPMLFVEPQSRAVVANQADPQGKLTAQNGVFTGTLPPEVGIANAAIEWAGVKWTMLIWPLPKELHTRTGLMLHELFHRIQADVGFPANNPQNSHLDEMEGRIFLQLEWRALLAAIRQNGEAKKEHLRDALLFRQARRQQFPDAEASENALEMNEGLAEYTGLRLSDRTDEQSLDWLQKQIERAVSLPSFVRSFAYTSGPLYGTLLDQLDADWRVALKNRRDFGALLVEEAGFSLPTAGEANIAAVAEKYDGEALRQREQARENERQARLAALRKKLIEGPVLVLPFHKPNLSFNPNNLQPLGEHGTVYTGIYLSDIWGVLETSDAALVAPDWSQVTISATQMTGVETNSVKGDGWTLELEPGWIFEAGKRSGDFRLKQED